MLYLFRLLLLFINIDQETVLNWFGMEDPTNPSLGSVEELSKTISFNTFQLILEGLWEKIQDGLTFADIENVLFFILFLRFIILAVRYNLKTSFYITCIGLCAGYLWYRHLIDIIFLYVQVIVKFPFFNKLATETIELRVSQQLKVVADIGPIGENAHMLSLNQILVYAFKRGIIDTNPETGFKYYIDPISMLISTLPEPVKSKVLPVYYGVYNEMIPKIVELAVKFWKQFSSIAAYVVITRLGKRYCPYLIRWHWTFLLILGLIEQSYINFIQRVSSFQFFVLGEQIKEYGNYIDPKLILQNNFLIGLITCLLVSHIGFIFFALFHAICGQYFYFPFLVENNELHVGPRPTNSIYSGGYTAWQDSKEKEQKFYGLVPKLWYGWFGRGTTNSGSIRKRFLKSIQKLFKIGRKLFGR